VISPRGDAIGEEIGADGRQSRQGKNYQKNDKTKHPCKAYISLGQEVLPSAAKIPLLVSKAVWAGVDRHGCAGLGMRRVRSPTGKYNNSSDREGNRLGKEQASDMMSEACMFLGEPRRYPHPPQSVHP
jgi:hypothetical protein